MIFKKIKKKNTFFSESKTLKSTVNELQDRTMTKDVLGLHQARFDLMVSSYSKQDRDFLLSSVTKAITKMKHAIFFSIVLLILQGNELI